MIRVGLRRIDAAELLESDAELRDCPLVHAVPPALRGSVFAEAVARRFPAGASLFTQGAPSGPVYLILRGEVRLTSTHGEETVDFQRATRGQVVGESAALAADARPYGALAATEVDVLELPRAALADAARSILELHAYLSGEQRTRETQASEMSDFFGRW